jgi:predicted enzyme related to lactoylglutathione lyase
MPGPARAGALVYAKDLQRMSVFYQRLLPMTRLAADDEHHVLESPDLQLVVHAIPPHIAATFAIAVPPERREEQAIKLFFTVDSLARAAAVARSLGGELFDGGWSGPGFTARNGMDPEGNVFQLRELLR